MGHENEMYDRCDIVVVRDLLHFIQLQKKPIIDSFSGYGVLHFRQDIRDYLLVFPSLVGNFIFDSLIFLLVHSHPNRRWVEHVFAC